MTAGRLPKSVLARGVSLLRVCGDSEPALTLAEPALCTGLPKPHRGGRLPHRARAVRAGAVGADRA